MELGDRYESFNALDSLGKASFILGNELWEEKFASHLGLVKEYIVDLGGTQFKTIRQFTQQPSPHSPAGDLGDVAGVIRRAYG